ncbi:MAG: hypothetical protein ABIS07_03235, partial [Dokdonella sp.]
MSTFNSLLRFASGIVFGSAMVADEVGAQVCAVPAVVAVNTSIALDTCQGDSGLVIACALFPLTGPAAVVGLQLAYPVGLVSVLSLTPGYDPALFLLRSHCDNSAACGMAVNSGVVVDTMDLGEVDSGDYFLAIASADFDSISCGQITVTYSMTAQQQALALDGVFRSSISAPPANP